MVSVGWGGGQEALPACKKETEYWYVGGGESKSEGCSK